MLCPQGHPLPVPDFTAKFCPTCGSALINPCPVGHDNVSNARFCRDCGRSMGLPSGRPTQATVPVVPPTTAVVPATLIDTAATPRTVGVRPTETPALQAPLDGAEEIRRRGRGLLIAIVVIAVAVVAVVVAVMATSSSPSANSPTTPSTLGTQSTVVPSTTSTSTPLSPQALGQGQALTALLSQSSGSRSEVGTATASIASCGDLAGAQSSLTAAQASRQALVSQLTQLDLSALPQSSALTDALTNAWQSSASSDGAYAQWAADEQTKTCVPNDTSDPSYQTALADDGHASTAKDQFSTLWNPIALSLGLQQWQPNQF